MEAEFRIMKTIANLASASKRRQYEEEPSTGRFASLEEVSEMKQGCLAIAFVSLILILSSVPSNPEQPIRVEIPGVYFENGSKIWCICPCSGGGDCGTCTCIIYGYPNMDCVDLRELPTFQTEDSEYIYFSTGVLDVEPVEFDMMSLGPGEVWYKKSECGE